MLEHRRSGSGYEPHGQETPIAPKQAQVVPNRGSRAFRGASMITNIMAPSSKYNYSIRRPLHLYLCFYLYLSISIFCLYLHRCLYPYLYRYLYIYIYISISSMLPHSRSLPPDLLDISGGETRAPRPLVDHKDLDPSCPAAPGSRSSAGATF